MRFSLFERLIPTVPFLIPLFILLGALFGIIPHGLEFNQSFAAILAIILFGYVLAVLWGRSRFEQSHPQSDSVNKISDVPTSGRKWVLLLLTSIIGGLFSFIVLNPSSMRSVIPWFLFAIGCWGLTGSIRLVRSIRTPRPLTGRTCRISFKCYNARKLCLRRCLDIAWSVMESRLWVLS